LSTSTEEELNQVLERMGEKDLTWGVFKNLDAALLEQWIPILLDHLHITSIEKLKYKTRIWSIWARKPGQF